MACACRRFLQHRKLFPSVLLNHAGASDRSPFRNRLAVYDLYKHNKGWTGWLLPAGVFLTAGFQVFIVSGYTNQIGSAWMYILGLLGLGTVIALIVMKHKPFGRQLTVITMCVDAHAAVLVSHADPLRRKQRHTRIRSAAEKLKRRQYVHL